MMTKFNLPKSLLEPPTDYTCVWVFKTKCVNLNELLRVVTMFPAEMLNVLEFPPGTVKKFPIAISELAFGLSEPVNDAFVDSIFVCCSSATENE